MKTYYVSVEIKEVHTYEVKANSEEEAYNLIDDASLEEPTKPVDFNTGEPIPGVEYGDCMVRDIYTYTDIEAGEESPSPWPPAVIPGSPQAPSRKHIYSIKAASPQACVKKIAKGRKLSDARTAPYKAARPQAPPNP